MALGPGCGAGRVCLRGGGRASFSSDINRCSTGHRGLPMPPLDVPADPMVGAPSRLSIGQNKCRFGIRTAWFEIRSSPSGPILVPSSHGYPNGKCGDGQLATGSCIRRGPRRNMLVSGRRGSESSGAAVVPVTPPEEKGMSHVPRPRPHLGSQSRTNEVITVPVPRPQPPPSHGFAAKPNKRVKTGISTTLANSPQSPLPVPSCETPRRPRLG